MINLTISKQLQIKYTQTVIDKLTSRSEEFENNLIKFYENNKVDLTDIGVIELTKTSWADFQFYAKTTDDEDDSFGIAINNLIESEVVEEIAEEDPEFLLSLYIPWIKKIWDRIDNKYKTKNILVLNSDDNKGFWLNQNRWIVISDETYEKLFDIK